MRLRVILPLIVVMALVCATVGVVVSHNISSYMVQTTDLQMTQALNVTRVQLEISEQIEKDTRLELDAKNLALARSLAQIIAGDPSVLATERLAREAERLGAAEACVTDATGVIRWSSDRGALGRGFSEDTQAALFLPLLNDTTLELVQDPQRRPASGELFQYVAVARVDETGIVRLGFSMRTFESVTQRLVPQTVIQGVLVGTSGGVFVLDASYNVIADSASLYLNINVAGQPWVAQLSNEQMATFEFEYGTTPVRAKSLYHDDKTVVAYVPLSELESFRSSTILTVCIVGGLGLMLMIFLTLFALNRAVFGPLDSIVSFAQKLHSGERFNTKKPRRGPEFAFVTQTLNEMLDRVEGPREMLDRSEGSGGAALGFTGASAVDAGAGETAVVSGAGVMVSGVGTVASARNAVTPTESAAAQTESAGTHVGAGVATITGAKATSVRAEVAGVATGASASAPSEAVAPPLEARTTPPHEAVATPPEARATSPEIGATPPGTRSTPPEAGTAPTPASFVASSEASTKAARPSLTSFTLEQIFHKVVPRIHPQLLKKELGFSVLLDKAVPQHLYGDAEQLAQALEGTLAKAIAATARHGRIECASRLLDVREDYCSISISVRRVSAGTGSSDGGGLTFRARGVT
jgi:methyl-accepting chemotaxis protein